MRLLVELSGEHPALARAEALAAIEASGRPARLIAAEDRILAVETDADPAWLARRLGLANFVDELVARGDLEEMVDAAKSLDLGGRSFAVRVNSYKGCHMKEEVERRLGGVVRGPVDLEAPQEEVRLIEGERHYLCRRIAMVDRRAFEKRKVGDRAFVQPISLHPRLARALVNLSRVPDGGTLLDPFCGTGGILLEAALAGARAVGSDVRADMVEGSRRSLAAFGATADLFVADIGEIAANVGFVDAIGTDPPYGRATSTKGEPVRSVIRRAIGVAGELLRPGRHLAMIVPDPSLADLPEEFVAVESFALRVHRSLTRHFVTARRAA